MCNRAASLDYTAQLTSLRNKLPPNGLNYIDTSAYGMQTTGRKYDDFTSY